MRVAIVTHNIVKGDGQGRANYEIVQHALDNGVDITLIADRVQEDLLQHPRVRWIKVQPRIRSNWLMHGLEFVARADQLLDRMQGEFDVIHGYGYCLDRRHHINTAQFVHSAWRRSPMHPARLQKTPYGAYQWLYSAINALGERRAFGKAKVIVAASSTVRGELRTLGVPEDRLRVILNGADLKEFYPAPLSREKLGMPKDVTLALFAGDIRSNRKNLDTVLKALVQVPEVHLAVVGKLEGSPFPKMAEELGLQARVHFLDFRRDIADVMRACDFFVFPSRYEACALVLVEAIASGLPVITAKTTGGAEVVNSESGIQLDDPNDVNALAGALKRLSSDPARRKEMAKSAREAAMDHSWHHVAESYLNLYRQYAGK